MNIFFHFNYTHSEEKKFKKKEFNMISLALYNFDVLYRSDEVLLPTSRLVIGPESVHQVCPYSQQRYDLQGCGDSSGKIQVFKDDL